MMAARRASVKLKLAADGAQHLAVLPPQLGGVSIVVALVHDGVERRIELAVQQRIGEIVLLDQTLEALQFRDVLAGRHADEPARQRRLDEHADLGNVADEVLVDGPHARAAVRRE